MSTLSELEAQLRENPDDWERWLVYADWLTEQGDDHGRLILLEHQLAAQTLPSKDQEQLQRKIRSLNKKNKWGGNQPLRRKAGDLRWRYGFFVRADLFSPAGVEALGFLLDHPCAHQLVEVALQRIPHEELETLIELLARSHVHTLSLVETPLRPEALERLLGTRRWRELVLRRNHIGEEGAQVLASHPSLEALESLDLSHNDLPSSAAVALARSPRWSALHSLHLEHNLLSDEGTIALARSDAFPSLKVLSLEANGIGDAGALALANPPAMPALTELDLSWNRIDEEIQGKLLAMRPGLQLIWLSREWGDFEDEDEEYDFYEEDDEG